MRAWNELSMAEKADVMKLAIEGGVYDLDAIRSGYNEFASGGRIHIKPENRGKFTALKKRTGHSATWFKEHGTPAQRKMATFALNARKWKHEDGGNLYDGTSQPTQKMNIGFNTTNGWRPYTLGEIVNNGERVARQREALEEAMRNFQIESNDATSVARGRSQNTHLEEKAVRGGEANAAWEREHPNLTAWGNVLGAVPFAVATAPAILTGGDALAATLGGQAVTRGLNFAANAAKATPYVSTLLPWAEALFNTGVATHGIQELKEGTFTPMTAMELASLAPPTIGIGNNLYLPHLREHVYASKAPIGYDGIASTIRKTTEGILSGKRADIDNPLWFNAENAQKLQEYASVPDYIQGVEKEQYLKEFGERALRARTDMWRMYNKMPQKFNTFVPSERYPGAYTAPEDIKALKWVPTPNENTNAVDFVNSVGGNVGKPTFTYLGRGISEGENAISKEFGVTTTSDWWDLHPFSRPDDRLISRLQRGWRKTIGKAANKIANKIKYTAENSMYNNSEIKAWLNENKNDEYAMEFFDPDMFPRVGIRRKVGEKLYDFSQKVRKSGRAPSFEFLKPLDEKVANFEIGKLINAKPVLVKYDVPWTADKSMVMLPEGGVDIRTTYTQGFNSNNVLPSTVDDWKKGVTKFNTDDLYNWLDLNNIIIKTPKVKR